MKDKEQFENFKEKMIKDNEEKYGEEVRKKYGNDIVEKSNSKVKNMTKEKYVEAENISKKMMECLKKAFELNDSTCEFAQKAVELHKKWLCIFYDGYCKEYHLGLADMYVTDERFKKNYEILGQGATEFFREAIKFYLNK